MLRIFAQLQGWAQSPNYKVVVRSMLAQPFSWAFVPNYPTAEPFNFAEPWNLRNCLSAQLPNCRTLEPAQLPNLGTLPNCPTAQLKPLPNLGTKPFAEPCRTAQLKRLPDHSYFLGF